MKVLDRPYVRRSRVAVRSMYFDIDNGIFRAIFTDGALMSLMPTSMSLRGTIQAFLGAITWPVEEEA
ncbi:MAG: hypothetical protein DRN15_05850 [Thermoprotei archaeon]|nr:MAG: hypothetical protein DRN15_05850 [Thermoprotei archaeon]RLF23605.1 MAG: hypothetical protein DRM97_04595 [Thermoprotei archaeon]